MKPYQVNLNGVSAMHAMFKVRSCEFDAACDYCLDAPNLLPSGSTRPLPSPPGLEATISTSYWREI
jgi:hypothetical protein